MMFCGDALVHIITPFIAVAAQLVRDAFSQLDLRTPIQWYGISTLSRHVNGMRSVIRFDMCRYSMCSSGNGEENW